MLYYVNNIITQYINDMLIHDILNTNSTLMNNNMLQYECSLDYVYYSTLIIYFRRALMGVSNPVISGPVQTQTYNNI